MLVIYVVATQEKGRWVVRKRFGADLAAALGSLSGFCENKNAAVIRISPDDGKTGIVEIRGPFSSSDTIKIKRTSDYSASRGLPKK
jgi:hypothetical protein